MNGLINRDSEGLWISGLSVKSNKSVVMSHISLFGVLSKVTFHNEEAEPRMHLLSDQSYSYPKFDFFLIFSYKAGGRCAGMCVLSHVRLFSTQWTVARQAPLSMELSRQEYWSGLPFPTPQGRFFLKQNNDVDRGARQATVHGVERINMT